MGGADRARTGDNGERRSKILVIPPVKVSAGRRLNQLKRVVVNGGRDSGVRSTVDREGACTGVGAWCTLIFEGLIRCTAVGRNLRNQGCGVQIASPV
jgi:hypothetical protein